MFSKLAVYALCSMALIFSVLAQADDLRSPLAYSLGVTERRSEVKTDIGVFTFKWSRASESFFGRNPERALADAAQTVRKALIQSNFTPALKVFSQPWEIVMLDETTAQRELKGSLATNCHPGWMVPPNNIYVVAERAAQYCGGREVPAALADRRLAQILIHEIGHALEFKLLGEQQNFDRMRAEGFAAWFEQYASEFSGSIPRGSVRLEYRKLLSPQVFAPDWRFSGSASDYARAALFFELLEKKRGVAGVMQLYPSTLPQPVFWENYSKVLCVTAGELQRQLAALAGK